MRKLFYLLFISVCIYYISKTHAIFYDDQQNESQSIDNT